MLTVVLVLVAIILLPFELRAVAITTGFWITTAKLALAAACVGAVILAAVLAQDAKRRERQAEDRAGCPSAMVSLTAHDSCVTANRIARSKGLPTTQHDAAAAASFALAARSDECRQWLHTSASTGEVSQRSYARYRQCMGD